MSVEKFSGQFKNETKGCTVVINSTIQSIKEFDVLGLYVYLCSKPESWQPNAKEIMHHTGYSKDKTYRLINRLLDMGLMTARAIREKGRFLHYEYTIHLHAQGFSSLPENQEPAPCPENRIRKIRTHIKQRTYKSKIKTLLASLTTPIIIKIKNKISAPKKSFRFTMKLCLNVLKLKRLIDSLRINLKKCKKTGPTMDLLNQNSLLKDLKNIYKH